MFSRSFNPDLFPKKELVENLRETKELVGEPEPIEADLPGPHAYER